MLFFIKTNSFWVQNGLSVIVHICLIKVAGTYECAAQATAHLISQLCPCLHPQQARFYQFCHLSTFNYNIGFTPQWQVLTLE